MRSSDSRLAWLKDKKIGLISGGPSNEKDVSKRSAKNVANALNSLGINFIELDPLNPEFFSSDFDIAFNCLHGRWGEDGALQGYCDLKGIKYTGPGIKATTIGFDKQLFKRNIQHLEYKTPAIVQPSNNPFIIKPNSDGSSIGVHLVKTLDNYHQLVDKQPELLSSDYFFEDFIDGIEVTSGVLKIDNHIKVLPILEIQSKNEFYDLDAKYTPGKTSLFYRPIFHQK